MEHSHGGHRERTRERFLATGFAGFEQHNILELLLFYCIVQKDTNGLAHQLIERFGSLSGVLDAPYEELLQVKGIGSNAAVLLKMIPQLAQAYLLDKNSVGVVLDSTEKVGRFLVNKFVGTVNETMYLLCLDNKNKLLSCAYMGEGTIQAVKVTPRKVVEQALRVSASAVILAHNHPQGHAIPSGQDIVATRVLSENLKALEIRLLDHIIVSRDDFVSMAQSQLF